MVWPKSGCITSSATSVSSSPSAIEVAGISGRRADSANSHAASTTKAGLADSEAWMLMPISVIQRRDPLTSGPTSSVATISTTETANTISAARRICRGDRKETPISTTIDGSRQQHMAVEEVERIEPDPGRHRRTGRQRQDNAAQDQRDDRRQQQAVDRPPPFGKRGALFTGDHGRFQKAEVTPIGGRGWFPRG